MRHLVGIFVLLVLAGIALVVARSIITAQRRQRRATRRGMRINLGDSASDKPTDLKED